MRFVKPSSKASTSAWVRLAAIVGWIFEGGDAGDDVGEEADGVSCCETDEEEIESSVSESSCLSTVYVPDMSSTRPADRRAGRLFGQRISLDSFLVRRVGLGAFGDALMNQRPVSPSLNPVSNQYGGDGCSWYLVVLRTSGKASGGTKM